MKGCVWRENLAHMCWVFYNNHIVLLLILLVNFATCLIIYPLNGLNNKKDR